MCRQGDVEIIPNWRSHKSIADLKRMVEERGYSAFTISSGEPSFGHAALKSFKYQLTPEHCKHISSCCNHPSTIWIYHPDGDEQGDGEAPPPLQYWRVRFRGESGSGVPAQQACRGPRLLLHGVQVFEWRNARRLVPAYIHHDVYYRPWRSIVATTYPTDAELASRRGHHCEVGTSEKRVGAVGLY